MDTRLAETAITALDRWRYDPPAWSGRQIVIMVVLAMAFAGGLYLMGRSHGYMLRGARFDAEMKAMVAKTRAEDQARLTQIQAELDAERSKAQIEAARFEKQEAALVEALTAAAKMPATPVAGACEAPVAPLNAVISEVNRGRR